MARRLAVDATNRRDLATLDATWSEEAEFHSTFAASEGRVFRGRHGIREPGGERRGAAEVEGLLAALGDAAGDDVVDEGRIEVVAVKQRHQRGRQQGRGMDMRQAAAGLPPA